MSKYQKYVDDGTYIYPHKHCPRCNAVMDEDRQYCSEECLNASTYKSKRSKRNTIIQIAIMVAVVAVFVIIMFAMQPPAS